MSRKTFDIFLKNRQQVFCCLFFLFSSLLISCRGNDEEGPPYSILNNSEIYNSHELKLGFKITHKYEHGDFFIINDVVFKHDINFLRKVNTEDTVYLPSSRYIYQRVETRDFYTRANAWDLARAVYSNIAGLDNMEYAGPAKYVDITGMVHVKNTEGIHLIKSKNYPLIIEVIKD